MLGNQIRFTEIIRQSATSSHISIRALPSVGIRTTFSFLISCDLCLYHIKSAGFRKHQNVYTKVGTHNREPNAEGAHPFGQEQ